MSESYTENIITIMESYNIFRREKIRVWQAKIFPITKLQKYNEKL